MNENESPEPDTGAAPGTPVGVADEAPATSPDAATEPSTADALRAAIEASAEVGDEPTAAPTAPDPAADAGPAAAEQEQEQEGAGPAEPGSEEAERDEAEASDEGEGAEDAEEAEGAEEAEPPRPHQRFDCTGGDVEDAAEAARAAVEAGECIVLPTDTVYGIGADAFSAAAVQRLLDAKGRGRDMPPPVLISDASMLKALSQKVPDGVQAVIDRFWPGALTIVVHAKESLKLDLGETEGTIGLRVPDHALARDLLRRTGPLAVSSANRTGSPAAENVDDAIEMLGDSVAVYLDAGPSPTSADGAPPSTIVDFTTHDGGRVLRVGAIPVEDLRELLPDLIAPRPKPVITSAADISAAILALEAEPATPEAPDPAADPVADPAAGPDTDDPGAAGSDEPAAPDAESDTAQPPS